MWYKKKWFDDELKKIKRKLNVKCVKKANHTNVVREWTNYKTEKKLTKVRLRRSQIIFSKIKIQSATTDKGI